MCVDFDFEPISTIFGTDRVTRTKVKEINETGKMPTKKEEGGRGRRKERSQGGGIEDPVIEISCLRV